MARFFFVQALGFEPVTPACNPHGCGLWFCPVIPESILFIGFMFTFSVQYGLNFNNPELLCFHTYILNGSIWEFMAIYYYQ
ncbi:MAG: hypothetical protein D3925_00390 [Candidatus Electrothrix sp. AR5]|nr:hypothetical protein [Candidatus Electrothrix sp. AR5]